MDTSKEYIKMCEKAVEVQELWSPICGDRVSGVPKEWLKEKPEEKNFCVIEGFAITEPSLYRTLIYGKGKHGDPKMLGEKTPNDIIWLPRQDQLQGMVKKSEKLWAWQIIRDWWVGLCKENIGIAEKYIIYLKTNEQLWLAFVMKEKFNKTWDGESWVKQPS